MGGSLLAMIIGGDNILHIIYNLYLIYFGGFLIKQYLGEQKLLSTFLLSATVGLGVFAINYSDMLVSPISLSSFVGAGAIGLLAASATYMPNYGIRLVIFGNVKLKWLAIVLIGLDILSIATQGQEYRISNIGGAGFGYLSIMAMKQQSGGMGGFKNPFAGLFNSKPKFTTSVNDNYTQPKAAKESDAQYNERKKVEQEEIDIILDKVRRNGYEGLSKEEKQKLFNKSKDL